VKGCGRRLVANGAVQPGGRRRQAARERTRVDGVSRVGRALWGFGRRGRSVREIAMTLFETLQTAGGRLGLGLVSEDDLGHGCWQRCSEVAGRTGAIAIASGR
jgi:hypothetical protein